MRYDAAPLNTNRDVVHQAQQFAASGYTVFAINHRQAPRFRHPAPIEDAQRAVRFVRFHAARFGVTSDKIGAWGASSGGHLVELLGTMDGKGDASDSDPVNRLDATVQAVVALFAPADLGLMFNTMSRPGTLTALMGFAYQDPATGPPGVARSDDWENRQYREASPLSHVTAGDAPMLLIHGDQDVVAPLKQSEVMEAALKAAHVQVTLIRVPGGKHGPNFLLPAGDPRVPDHVGEAVRWFNTHLTGRRTSLHSPSSVRLRGGSVSLGGAAREAR
jgi:acetyl esterase/lipase